MQTLSNRLLFTITCFFLFRLSLSTPVCQRCLSGYSPTVNNGNTDLDCDLCDTTACSACDAPTLPQFGVWGDNCSMASCRRGYTRIVDATNTARCVEMNEGYHDTSQDAAYLENGKWPPSVASDRHMAQSPFIANTGITGVATCTQTPRQCRQQERSIPCSWPFDSYCASCDEPIPSISNGVVFTAASAKRVANYEAYDTTRFWIYNIEAATFSNAVTPLAERLQVLKHNGARHSQIWLSMVSSVKPAGTLPHDAVVRLYVRCENVNMLLKFGRHTNERKINCGEWIQVIAPLGPGGIIITRMDGSPGTMSIDEISVISSLVPSYPGREPSWCVAGMFKDTADVCQACTTRHACPAVEDHQDLIECPPDSRSLPSSNTCICPQNSKAVPRYNSISCQNCTADEDCRRGYVSGTLVAWHEQPGDAPSKLEQLSCGPLSCCAVDQVGDVLCWGDNRREDVTVLKLNVLTVNSIINNDNVNGVPMPYTQDGDYFFASFSSTETIPFGTAKDLLKMWTVVTGEDEGDVHEGYVYFQNPGSNLPWAKGDSSDTISTVKGSWAFLESNYDPALDENFNILRKWKVGDVIVFSTPRFIPVETGRLGSSVVTKPWIFAQDASPVQGLYAPAVAVTVSQQTDTAESDMSCALLEDGTAKCWGWFRLAAIDDPTLVAGVHVCHIGIEDDGATDDPLCGFKNETQAAVSLRVSSGTACVATEAGEIWCWGRDLWTGTGPEAVPRPPRRWDTLLLGVDTDTRYGASDMVDFALGERFICAIYAVTEIKNVLMCAGRATPDDIDELKTGFNFNFARTGIVLKDMLPDGLGAKSIRAAGNRLLFETTDNHVVVAGGFRRYLPIDSIPAWPPYGHNGFWADSTAGRAYSDAWSDITLGEVSPIDNTADIFICWKGTHAHREVEVTCQATNSNGLLLQDGISDDYRRIQIPTLKTATQIALGEKHGCAGLENGDVVCWGHGANGRLGNTTCRDVGTEAGDTPVLVGGLKLLSLKPPSRTWALTGGVVEYTPTITREVLIQALGTTSVEYIQSSWKLPYQAYISHPLALRAMTHGSYINDNTDAHWVQVYVYVSCGKNDDNAACKLVLARNLRNVTVLDSDYIFHAEDINAGDSKQISSVFWAYHGDSISVLSYAANTTIEVMSVSAFEDSDSCAYTCPSTHHMRNRDCVECSMGGCLASQYTVSCNGGGMTPTAVCLECDASPVLRKLDFATYYVKEGTQCYSQCDVGFFNNGAACMEARVVMCAVGSYLKPHTSHSDATCTPCTTDTPSDTNRVFVTDGATEDNCEEQCITGNFLPSPQHTCTDCNPSRCNQGSQYSGVTQCTRNQSAQCFPCTDPLVTSSGTRFIGQGEATCTYECAVGFRGIPRCGVWDLQTKSILRNISDVSLNETGGSGTHSLYLNSSIKESAAVVDIVLRMRGSIRISAYNHGSKAEIRYVQDGVTTLLQTYTPRLDVNNHVATFDSISLDWDLHIDADMSTVDVYIKATWAQVDIQGLRLEIQQREQCSTETYKCIECGDSKLTSNSSYIRSHNCDWECDFEYERREDNTCMSCPFKVCPVGMYMADCEQCLACVKHDTLSIFTSPGDTRGLETSCTTVCPTGHFSDPEDQVCTQCASNITCGFSMYQKPCTAIRDMHCMGCTMCEPGFFSTTLCNSTSDTLCKTCTSSHSVTGGLPEHATWAAATYTSTDIQQCRWECDPGYVEDPVLKICKRCIHTCGIGQYITECIAETQWEGCSPCVKPPNSTFIGTGREKSNSCPWECNGGLELRGSKCEEVYRDTPASTPAALCTLQPGDCEPGHHVAVDPDGVQAGSGDGQPSETGTVCACKACTPHPNASIAQYIKRGECDWVCSYPYIRTGVICERLLDITRKTIAIRTPNTTEQPVVRKNWTVTTIEPVTGLHLTNGSGTHIKPAVILLGMVPFFVTLVVSMCIGLRMSVHRAAATHEGRGAGPQNGHNPQKKTTSVQVFAVACGAIRNLK